MEKLPNEILETILDNVGDEISYLQSVCRLWRDVVDALVWRRVTIRMRGPALMNRVWRWYKCRGHYDMIARCAKHVSDVKCVLELFYADEYSDDERRMVVEVLNVVVKNAPRLRRVQVEVYHNLLLQEVGAELLEVLGTLDRSVTVEFSHTLNAPFQGGYTEGSIERSWAMAASINASYTASLHLNAGCEEFEEGIVREVEADPTKVRDLGIVSRSNCAFLTSGIIPRMTSLATLCIFSGELEEDNVRYDLDLPPSVELVRLLVDYSTPRRQLGTRCYFRITGSGVRRLFMDGELMASFALDVSRLTELTLRIDSALDSGVELPKFDTLNKLTVFSNSSRFLYPIRRGFSRVTSRLVVNVDCPNIVGGNLPDAPLAVLPEVLEGCRVETLLLLLPYYAPEEMADFWRAAPLAKVGRVYYLHSRCKSRCEYLDCRGYIEDERSRCSYEIDMTEFRQPV